MTEGVHEDYLLSDAMDENLLYDASRSWEQEHDDEGMSERAIKPEEWKKEAIQKREGLRKREEKDIDCMFVCTYICMCTYVDGGRC